MKRCLSLLWIGFLLASLAACRPGTPVTSPAAPPSPAPSPTPLPTATATVPPSPTPRPAALVLLDGEHAGAWAAALQPVAQTYGLAFRRAASLEGLDVTPRLVVAVESPPPDLPPDLPLVLLGAGEGAAGRVVVQTNPDALRPAFLAGYLAALVTPDWRVGVLAAESPVVEAFTDGVVYFCGLCLPAYPPFYDYPRGALLPAPDADPTETLRTLADQGVQTVYLPFDLSAPSWQAALQAVPDLQIIGRGTPPSEALQWRWVASVDWDVTAALTETVASLLRGADVPPTITPTLIIHQVNPRRLSPGRQANAEALIPDLLAGWIEP